jgi:hypothetical protein
MSFYTPEFPGVQSVVAGTNVTIGGTSSYPIINASGGGGGSVVAGANISVVGSAVSVSNEPIFTKSMAFSGFGTISKFENKVYPYGAPPQYYPYVTNVGTDVSNTIGGKQFWATNVPGSTTNNVIRYKYNGIEAQQSYTGTTIPFMAYDDATGRFSLSNVQRINGATGTYIDMNNPEGGFTFYANDGYFNFCNDYQLNVNGVSSGTGRPFTLYSDTNITIESGGDITINATSATTAINLIAGSGGIKLTDNTTSGTGRFTIDSANHLYWNGTLIA